MDPRKFTVQHSRIHLNADVSVKDNTMLFAEDLLIYLLFSRANLIYSGKNAQYVRFFLGIMPVHMLLAASPGTGSAFVGTD